MDSLERPAELPDLSVMVSEGVPENYIEVIGLGYDPAFCLDDSPDGTFEESIAKENRCVVILPYMSSEAQDILARAGSG